MTDRERIACLEQQNAALAAALEQRRSCKRCGGTGRYLAYPPTMYETDTDEERDDAIRMAERKCPDCAVDPRAILTAHDAEKDRKIAELAAAVVRVVNLFSEISLKGHKTGYDWNADPESLTLIGSRIFEAQEEPEKILAAHDAAVRRPLLEALDEAKRVMDHDVTGIIAPWIHKTIEQIDSLLARYNDDGSERK